MAKIQCNVISYTLMRTVDIDVILPTVTIPESMINKGKIHHDYHKKFPVLYYMDLEIIMHNGVAIQMLNYMLKKDRLLLL